MDNEIVAFITHLQAENAALKAGQYAQLDVLALGKERAFARAMGAGPGAGDLELMASTLRYNQRLLDAAAKGVRAAQARIAALQEVRSNLRVYDQTGQLQMVAMNRAGVERKA